MPQVSGSTGGNSLSLQERGKRWFCGAGLWCKVLVSHGVVRRGCVVVPFQSPLS